MHAIKITKMSPLEGVARFFKEMKKRGTLLLPYNSSFPYKWFDINIPVKANK